MSFPSPHDFPLFSNIKKMKFEELVKEAEKIRKIKSKNDKIKALANILKQLRREEIRPCISFLLGHFPPLNIGIGSLKKVKPYQRSLSEQKPTAEELYTELIEISKRSDYSKRKRMLEAILSKLSDNERKFFISSLLREVRIGVDEGLMLEAICRATGAYNEVRRAYMFSDIIEVAELALSDPKKLIKKDISPLSPVRPMLAVDGSLDEVLKRKVALEYKYDGMRVQVHKKGDKIRIFSRRLKDISEFFPEIVEMASKFNEDFILEGEIIAFKGAPLPFQFLMRRFRRSHEKHKFYEEIPVRIFFFDVLYFNRSIINESYEKRWKVLEKIVEKDNLAKRIIPTTMDEAREFLQRAIEEGYEGVMAKDLKSKYNPGKRDRAWFKIKPYITLDLVIIAAEWGHGRREGWLSNYHLAARDRTGYTMVGKTFKGLTDEEFEYLTKKLLSLKIKEKGNVVYVNPKIVVEVAFNEIQKSKQYSSGFALRFARIIRIREDKSAEEADTLEKVKEIYLKKYRGEIHGDAS